MSPIVARLLAGCAGFLLAVLWMDLMFDVQALGHAGDVPEHALASIAGYYRRVTTEAWPMGALIGTVMAVAVGGAVWQAVRAPAGRQLAAVALIALPVGLAMMRVFPFAVRLGQRTDPASAQSDLARAICHDHLVCLALVAAFLILQVRGARSAA